MLKYMMTRGNLSSFSGASTSTDRVRYHCLSTRIVVDNIGNIVSIKCGFLGHVNDARQWTTTTTDHVNSNRSCHQLGICHSHCQKMCISWQIEATQTSSLCSLHGDSSDFVVIPVENSLNKNYQELLATWKDGRGICHGVWAALAQRHILLTRDIR